MSDPAEIEALLKEAEDPRFVPVPIITKLAAALRAEATARQQLDEAVTQMVRKLEEGTLHVGYCNGNHDERVGKAGMVCNCTLGREIKELRHRAEKAEQELRDFKEEKRNEI